LAVNEENGWVFIDTRFHNIFGLKILSHSSEK